MSKKAAQQINRQPQQSKRPKQSFKNFHSKQKNNHPREKISAAELVATDAAIIAVFTMIIKTMMSNKPTVKKPMPHRPQTTLLHQKAEIMKALNAVETAAKTAIFIAAMMMGFAMTKTAATENKTRFFLAENPTSSTIMQMSMHPAMPSLE